MALIEVSGLTRVFSVTRRAPGLWGALRSLVSPETSEVRAVSELSFSVEEGELLAFIGPNGAGKSTTLKMLTGILFPTSGNATVSGLVPWADRERLSYRIGSVFGARSQLWFHLPPRETFRTLGTLYDLPRREIDARLAELSPVFDLDEVIDIPVRKLSLGQRMRCELAAALMHRPRILFLDEPTIGLDVVAKRRIRELIQELNREEGLTIFLTSHDAGDIERLCKRTLVVHHGRVMLDESTQVLKRRFFHSKLLSLRVREPPATRDEVAIPGVEVLKLKGPGLKLQVDLRAASIESVLGAVMTRYGIEDVTIKDPPLEDVIAAIYGTGDGEPGGSGQELTTGSGAGGS